VLRECQNPSILLVDEVQIESLRICDIGLGKSISTKKQLKEYAIFEDSFEQGEHIVLELLN
jgi:hypothetical protein